MRNKFVGGPNDGEVHLTFDLLTDDATRNSIPWEEYYNSGEPEPAVDGEIPVMVWHHLGDAVVPTDATPNSPQATVPAPGAEVAEAPESPDAPPPSGKPEKSELRKRREALRPKKTRQEIADAAGITIGVIARLETKGGTDAELAPVLAVLDALEA